MESWKQRALQVLLLESKTLNVNKACQNTDIPNKIITPMLIFLLIIGFLYFPAPGLLLDPWPWPLPRGPVLAPNFCLTALAPSLHLPALVSKLNLPTLSPARAPNLYLPVLVKFLLLLSQLLVLSLQLPLPPPPLLPLQLLQLLPILLLLLLLQVWDPYNSTILKKIQKQRSFLKRNKHAGHYCQVKQ